MFEKILHRITYILFAIIVWLAATPTQANDLYINQSGDNFTMNVTQDGQNNRISKKEDTVSSTPRNATFVGKNQSLTVSQTGNNNFLGLYKNTYGSDTQTSGTMDATQTGDDNVMRLDNHGDNNNFTAKQETSNSEMDLQYDGDNNTVDARQACHRGQYCEKDTMDFWGIGDNNDVKLGQGYKISSSGVFDYDTQEFGGHSMDLYMTGDGNDVILSQRANNTSTEHFMDINIYSDDNTVHAMQQHNNDKSLTLTINNDDNTVSINQQKSGGSQTATITLGGTYGTDLDLTMGSNNTTGAGTYSLYQNCQTVGGCSVSVTQD
jgi:hypothetical protein